MDSEIPNGDRNSLKQLRILLVDDEPSSVSSIQAALARAGVPWDQIDTFYAPRDALRHVERLLRERAIELLPSVAIIDLNMNGNLRAGEQLISDLRELYKRYQFTGVPAVAYTGYSLYARPDSVYRLNEENMAILRNMIENTLPQMGADALEKRPPAHAELIAHVRKIANKQTIPSGKGDDHV